MKKTNAMRLLDQAGIKYQAKTYTFSPDDLSGQKAAQALQIPEKQVYKTLMVNGCQSGYLVCCLSVNRALDLKRIAAISQNKRVELIPASRIQSLTGYVRGGCSPLAMKKKFPTYIDSEVMNCDQVAVSAGQRGLQILLSPADLIRAADAVLADIALKTDD